MSNNFLEKNFIYLMFYVPEFPRIGILKCRVYVGEFSVRCDDKLVICCLILTKVLDNLSP